MLILILGLCAASGQVLQKLFFSQILSQGLILLMERAF